VRPSNRHIERNVTLDKRQRCARLARILEQFREDNWRNLYAGELGVRPPGLPTTREREQDTRSQEELRAAFTRGTGWNVAAVKPDRIQTRFHDDGAPAWLATIKRI